VISFSTGVLAALFSVLTAGQGFAHEGHSHGDEAPPASVQTAPRATAASTLFELVAVADGANLTIYIDRFDTNEPVTEATVYVETPSGPVTATAEGEVFTIEAPWAADAGDYELLFTVEAGTDIDFLTATLTIPEGNAVPVSMAGIWPLQVSGASIAARLRTGDLALIAVGVAGFLVGILIMAMKRLRTVVFGIFLVGIALAFGAPMALAEKAPQGTVTIRDVAQRLPDGRIFAPKAAQRILAIRTIPAVEDDHRRSIEMAGRVIPDPNTSGFVQTAIGGRLRPPPGGFPTLGATVKAGDVMALVEPSLAAADQSSIRQSRAELDQDITLAERQLERARPLARSGAVSQAQLEEAELTLQGLRERRAALENLRMEAETLVAPVSGVVSKANAARGLIAETNTEVFHIIDPSQLWIEAALFGNTILADEASVTGADNQAVPLALVGAGFAEDGQAQPVHYRVTQATAKLRIGERLTVYAATASVTRGISAPREAVIRGANGETLVFVHNGPEIFEPRPVRVAPLDGGRVIILAGIAAGDRMVTQGAELLNQLR
jgi:membrane fusion protein, heavy metal efflux system